MGKAPVISSDAHIVEPPDMWEGRVPEHLARRVPHLVSESDGEWWYADGLKIMSFVSGINPGVRFENQDKMRRAGKFQEVRPGGYDANERIPDMDADGIDVDIIYPSMGLNLYAVPDPEVLTASFAAYNQWMAEFCQRRPDRLKGIACINLDDIPTAISQLEDAAKSGLVGAMVPCYADDRPYNLALYDPFWAAAQGLDMPLSLHVATNRPQPVRAFATPATLSAPEYWAEVSIANLIFGGVFERYPRLKVVSVEHEAAWAAHFLQSMDYVYTQRRRNPDWPRFKSTKLPSDFFHSNVFISFQEDELAMELRSRIGVDSFMWGSDYPHGESTFPRTRQILDKIMAGVPTDERAKMIGGNAAKLYHISAS